MSFSPPSMRNTLMATYPWHMVLYTMEAEGREARKGPEKGV